MARVARLGIVIDSSGAKRGAQEVNGALESTRKTAERTVDSFRQAANAIGVSLAGIGFAKLVGDAQSFEKQLALISTVLDETTGSTVVFRSELQKLFRSLPVGSMQELSKGLYDIVSAGVPAGDAMKYLEVSARASIAGVTSTATAVDALTTATNAWRLQSLTAQAASDQMFMAVNKGKMTFEQLASAMGTIAPIAAGYGISLQDVLGATAQLTLNGLTATEAMTGIRSAITNIINPTGTLAQSFPALAREFNATKLEALGFTQFLIEFNKAAGGSKEAINALFSDVQGKTAVFSLLADGGSAAAAQVQAVGNASGATDIAFGKLAATSAAAAQLLRNQFAAATTDLATQVLPAVNAGMSVLTDALEFIRANGPAIAGVVTALGTGWATYAVAVRASATWTAILGAAQTVQAFVSLAATVRSAADAMALLSIVGKGAVGAIAAIAAVAAGFAAYKAATAAMAADTKKFNEELQRTAKAQGVVLPPTIAATTAVVAQTKATREAASAAKDLQEALDKTTFSSGLARDKAIEHTNALRQFVQPVKMSYAEVLNFVQAQERAANAAAAHATAVRLGIADTVAYRAEVMTATQVEDLRAKGLTVTTEQIDRLRQANEKLVQSQDAKSPESPVAQTQAWTDALRDAIGVVQLLGQAFGDVGRTVSSIGTGAQSIVSGLQRASNIKNAQGQAVGIGGALSGAAGVTGVISGLGAAGAVVGGLVQIGDALDLFGRKAKERARDIAEATKRFNEGVAAFQTRALGQDSGVGNAIQQASRELQTLLAEAAKAFKGGALNRETVRVQGLYDASLEQIAGGFFTSLEDAFDRLNGNELAINIRRAGEELRERENAIMALRKSGAITAEEEAAALIRVKDLYDQTIASMETAAAAAKAAAEAEEKRRLAQQAFDRKQFGLDLTQRRQTLSGDTRGAFQTGQTIAGNSALAQAQQLVDAGTITADMFEQLKTLIGDEMVAALDAFDAAVAESALQQREDLEVRALVASGRSAEAQQRRIEIANRRELQGVTDEGIRAEILRVQAIEEGARAIEAAADAERRRQEQNADIDRRMIAVLQTLDPARAKQLQQMQTEADRAREIAEAADDATRARLRELHAMEDAAEALAVLTKAQEEAARIAREQADFTSSLNVQYLRSQGRGFDADVTELNEWRTTQRKLSASLGFGEGSEQWRQIDAVYASRYNALIAGTMQQDTATMPPPTATDPSSVTLGEDTIAVRSARSISESTALQLVDYAASQTALLRRLVQIAEGGSGPTGEALVSPSLDLVERRMGSRASTSAMLMGGVVR